MKDITVFVGLELGYRMISAEQILLARTKLKLNQEEVAQKVNMPRTTYSDLESGHSEINASKMKKLQQFFENEGVEFLEGNGVRDRRSVVKHYHGVSGFRTFMDDVYETAKEIGGDICLLNTTPRLWIEHLGQDWYDMHNKRMVVLGDHIRVRIAIKEGDRTFILGCAEYKWFPKDKWKSKVIYIYGGKLAFLDFSHGKIHITVFEEADLADSFRIMYNTVWEHETISVE